MDFKIPAGGISAALLQGRSKRKQSQASSLNQRVQLLGENVSFEFFTSSILTGFSLYSDFEHTCLLFLIALCPKVLHNN